MNEFKRPTVLDSTKIDIKGFLAALGLIMWGVIVGLSFRFDSAHGLSSTFCLSLSGTLSGWLISLIFSIRKTYKEEIRHYKWKIECERKLIEMRREIERYENPDRTHQ